MKFVKLINKEKVLNFAIKLIKNSHKEIILTMDLFEELKSPLPKNYHHLVSIKAKEGITVRRLGFGRIKDFQLVSKSFPKTEKFLFFYGGSLTTYQRMLIIDRKQAIFKVGEQVVFSDFEALVLSLVKLFEIIYNQRREL